MVFSRAQLSQDPLYNKSIGDYAPFAGSSKYVNFIRIKDKANFIDDMYKDYGSNNYDRDIKILEKKYKKEIHNLYIQNDSVLSDYPLFTNKELPVEKQQKFLWGQLIDELIDRAKEKNPVMMMWNITRELSSILSSNAKQASTKWNLILSKDLGYSGFADKSGKGYIHPSEPMQAVFFNTRAFDVITRIENEPAKRQSEDFLFKVGDKFRDITDGEEYEIKKRTYLNEPEYQLSFLKDGRTWYKQSSIQKRLDNNKWEKIK